MNTLTKLVATTAALTLGTVAMADPNIDMSQLKMDGGFTVDVTSQSIAGAIIQGSGNGTISATSGAWNTAGGSGGFEGGSFMDTDNAGAGVSGNFSGAGAQFTTFTTGGGFATTTGVGDTIEVTAGQFGSATMGFAGDIEVKLQSDDWN